MISSDNITLNITLHCLCLFAMMNAVCEKTLLQHLYRLGINGFLHAHRPAIITMVVMATRSVCDILIPKPEIIQTPILLIQGLLYLHSRALGWNMGVSWWVN